MTIDDKDIDFKFSRLKDVLTNMKSLLVAFSGGVDSTLLLRVAQMMLGDNVSAVTAVSETTPRHEMEDAKRFAAEFGVKHFLIESGELRLAEFLKNPYDRCYICKRSRFSAIIDLAEKNGQACVADGSNLDDLSDYRPGMKALRELEVRSPLVEAELTKADVRLLSKRLGLFTWDKPAYACLATRIPYETTITVEKLRQVDAAEDVIRSLSISKQVRVRHYGDTARIEVAREDIQKLFDPGIRDRVISFFKGLGFTFVTLDLEGYRMGSLNRSLSSATTSPGDPP
jgi:uncharacterized protein